jgi:hypothetical protein
MKRKYIKNARGQLEGYIDTDENGHESAKDVRGQLLGSYKPETDLTVNVKGQTTSYGDTLSSLIEKD